MREGIAATGAKSLPSRVSSFFAAGERVCMLLGTGQQVLAAVRLPEERIGRGFICIAQEHALCPLSHRRRSLRVDQHGNGRDPVPRMALALLQRAPPAVLIGQGDHEVEDMVAQRRSAFARRQPHEGLRRQRGHQAQPAVAGVLNPARKGPGQLRETVRTPHLDEPREAIQRTRALERVAHLLQLQGERVH